MLLQIATTKLEIKTKRTYVVVGKRVSACLVHNCEAFKETKLTVTLLRKDAPSDVLELLVGAAVSREGQMLHYAKVGQAGDPVLLADTDYKKIVPREETLLAPTPTPAPSTPEPAPTKP